MTPRLRYRVTKNFPKIVLIQTFSPPQKYNRMFVLYRPHGNSRSKIRLRVSHAGDDGYDVFLHKTKSDCAYPKIRQPSISGKNPTGQQEGALTQGHIFNFISTLLPQRCNGVRKSEMVLRFKGPCFLIVLGNNDLVEGRDSGRKAWGLKFFIC